MVKSRFNGSNNGKSWSNFIQHCWTQDVRSVLWCWMLLNQVWLSLSTDIFSFFFREFDSARLFSPSLLILVVEKRYRFYEFQVVDFVNVINLCLSFISLIYIYMYIYLFIYLFITDCCTYYLRPPRIAPAICGRKWTLCKCKLLIVIIKRVKSVYALAH